MPGRYLFDLAATMDTRSYPNGRYELTVDVSDMRGNSAEAVQELMFANGPEGCAPAQPAPSSSP